MRTVTPLAVLVVAGLAATGCSSEAALEDLAEGALELADGGDVDLDFEEDGGELSYQDDDGTFEQKFGSSADIPEDFPEDVALPPGFDLVSTFTTSDDTSANWSLGFQGSGSVSEVAAGLRSELEGAGFEVQNESMQSSGSSESVTMILQRGNLMVFVQVIADQEQSDQVTVSYTVTQNEDSTE